MACKSKSGCDYCDARCPDWYDDSMQANIEDIMICATRTYSIDREKLLDTFTHKGLIGVFNLGLETMYKYLQDKNKN